jgi:dTDP-4-dehydrorhamnose reductase
VTKTIHNVATCEREPERAFATNAIAVAHLAIAARDGAALATGSTVYVFSGDICGQMTKAANRVPRSIDGIFYARR